jgi:predicted transposase
MKVTRMAILDMNDHYSKIQLDQLMEVFCSAFRFSFNLLIEGVVPGGLIKRVNALFCLNKRYAEDAVMRAQSIIDSQKELLPSYIENTESKIKKSEQKLDEYLTGKKRPKKVPLELCVQGLTKRLEKLREKAEEIRIHIDNGTIPSYMPVVMFLKRVI